MIDGPEGAKGDPGDPGPAGAKGGKGDTGNSGPEDAKGDTGDPCPSGVKGDTGDPCVVGPKGDTGDTGAVGANGDTGDPSAACAKGDTGDPYIDGVSPDATGWVAILVYTSNTEVDEESGSVWTYISSFPLTITATIPKTTLIKYRIGSGSSQQAPRDGSVFFFDELEN